MKNFENKDFIDNNESSKDSADKYSADKFDKQMKKLERILKKEAKDRKEDEDFIDKIDEFFEEVREIDDNLEKGLDDENGSNKEVVSKFHEIQNKRIENRDWKVKEEIVGSADKILNEIRNRDSEPNVVASSLLKFADWILKTEK